MTGRQRIGAGIAAVALVVAAVAWVGLYRTADRIVSERRGGRCEADHRIAEVVRRQGATLVAAARSNPDRVVTPEGEQRIEEYLAAVERDAAAIDCTDNKEDQP